MGTHPIFESDFDCLTEMSVEEMFKKVDEEKFITILEETFDISADKFVDSMWNLESALWRDLMDKEHILDYQDCKTEDESKRKFTSRLKMININIPENFPFKIPTHCSQTTSILIKKTSDGYIVDTVTDAAEFPFADNFSILQRYELKNESESKMHLVRSFGVKWHKSNMIVKPFIKSDLNKQLHLSGQILKTSLLSHIKAS